SMLAAMASGWQQAGFSIDQKVIPATQTQEQELRFAYPGLFLQQLPILIRAVQDLIPETIATAQNNWSGNNRSGWTNPQYTDLAGQFSSTLDHDQRSAK